MKKSITLNDIASELNIDVSTVSKALKDHPKISSKTKEKVHETARRLDYIPNSIATALVKGKSNLIGVMVPHADESFFASVIRGIDEIVRRQGYRITIFQSYENTRDEISNIETMFHTKVDGIIASPAVKTKNFRHFQSILDRDIPLVLFDRFSDEVDSDVVAIDDFGGAYKAVCHLLDRGYAKIAHISGSLDVHIFNERLKGYKKALADYDVDYNPELIFETNLTIEDGQNIMSSILETNNLPDAVFCSNDRMALGVIKILEKEGIDIPGEIAVVGFSNEFFTSFLTPSLTSVDQHSRKIGKISAQHILERITNKMAGNKAKPPQKTFLKPKLIIRESSSKK